jgi:RNA polymerase sigma factor (sigma-70 family)
MQETPQIAAKWRRFKKTGCQQTRAELIEHYLPCARLAAARMAAQVAPRYRAGRYDDMLSANYEGLIKAVDAFSLTGGASFKTFAYHTMRGAALDWQRQIDPISRKRRKSGDYPRITSLEQLQERDSGDSANSRDHKPREIAAPNDTVRTIHLTDAANVAVSHTTLPKAEALWLHSKGLTNEEIAARQRIAATTVQWRHASGKREILANCNREDFIWD